jgi:hypothetical protein
LNQLGVYAASGSGGGGSGTPESAGGDREIARHARDDSRHFPPNTSLETIENLIQDIRTNSIYKFPADAPAGSERYFLKGDYVLVESGGGRGTLLRPGDKGQTAVDYFKQLVEEYGKRHP